MPENMERTPLLEIEGLKKYYPIEAGISKKKIGEVKAVDNVNLTIYKNEVLGVVGESGCGKTTLGRTVLRIIEPTDGKVKFHFDDKEIDFTALDKKELRQMRRHLQMIFQNPYTSLNPRMTIFDIVAEPMRLGGGFTEDEISERVKTFINKVGLEVKHLNRYPHAFSGGQRQRIGIARALAVNPGFIICDEPVSALDVSIQAQIINMLEELQETRKLTYLFIAHDLAIVKHISTRIGVMYLGHMVELAESAELYRNPIHPYTEMLLSAIPIADPDLSAARKRIKLEGEVPSPLNPPSGCPFRTRCPKARKACAESMPALREITPGHFAACHNA